MKSSEPEYSIPALLQIILLCIIFGANPVAVKLSLAGMGPFTNAGIRFAFAVVIIIFWAKITGRSLRVEKEKWGRTFKLGLVLSFQISLFYFGMTKTSASHSALIANLLPFFVLILSHFFLSGDRMSWRKVIGMILGFGGVSIIFFEKQTISTQLMIGDIIMLAAVFFWAVRAIYTKRIIPDFEPFHLVIYPFVIAAPLFLVGGMLFDPVMIHDMNASVISALLFQSVAIASVGYVAWSTLLKRYGASSLYSFIFIMPISGVFFGWLILDEPMTMHLLTSLILVTAGLFIFHRTT